MLTNVILNSIAGVDTGFFDWGGYAMREKCVCGVSMITMAVNSTRSLTEISGLGFDRFNAKSIELIDDK